MSDSYVCMSIFSRWHKVCVIVCRDTTGVNLPGGVSTKMSANDYFTRDARRLVEPPQVVFSFQSKLLGSGTEPALVIYIYNLSVFL